MTEGSKLYPAPLDFARGAHVPSMEAYNEWYRRSVDDPEEFWANQASRLQWEVPFDRVLEYDFHKARINWFEGGRLNASVNCIDRHIDAGMGAKTAIIWEGDDPGDTKSFTYSELLVEVSRFANVLKKLGVKKGDRVCIYLPMIPELAFCVLACARIGAVHSVVFGGFSADSLRTRVEDCDAAVVVTADEGVRGAKKIPLKATTDEALKGVECVRSVLVIARTGAEIGWVDGRDRSYEEEVASPDISDVCRPESMQSEDPLFILYTSGSTGQPKGVLHTTGGYMVYTAFTHEQVFDLRPDDIYWCTADIGWITGHSYIVYGPLANGATTVMFEGVPSYPDIGRFWDVVDRHKVTLFYTAPTAIRAIAQKGDEPVLSRSRKSLRLLGTVGEPINPDVWEWYHQIVGGGRCPIVDTWWQTETGGILISPLPAATTAKPGSATFPLFGIKPVLVDDEGKVLEGNDVEGNLCIDYPWPGIARTLYGDHDRFFDTYFSQFPGRYFTGDGCRRDEDGYYWITGRVDDVLNVSGHRMGTAEVESALVAHEAISEAAVVGMPHEIKGEGIYAFVILNVRFEASDALSDDLVATVRRVIGPIATPDRIQFCGGLPKTRSGKIMRRILRAIAKGQDDDFGDTSTLADPSVVNALVSGRG